MDFTGLQTELRPAVTLNLHNGKLLAHARPLWILGCCSFAQRCAAVPQPLKPCTLRMQTAYAYLTASLQVPVMWGMKDNDSLPCLLHLLVLGANRVRFSLCRFLQRGDEREQPAATHLHEWAQVPGRQVTLSCRPRRQARTQSLLPGQPHRVDQWPQVRPGAVKLVSVAGAEPEHAYSTLVTQVPRGRSLAAAQEPLGCSA